MAHAALSYEDEVEGRSWFRVEADPFGALPFAGSSRRAWDRFTVGEGGASATYEWKTGADREVAWAKSIAATESSDAIARYIERSSYASLHFDQYLEGYVEEEGLDPDELEPEQLEEAQRAFVEHVANGYAELAEADGGCSYYLFEDDAFLKEAAEALPLPEWAELEEADEGGVGSGYEAPFVVLQPGRTLRELAEWLEVKAKAIDAGKGKAGGAGEG